MSIFDEQIAKSTSLIAQAKEIKQKADNIICENERKIGELMGIEKILNDLTKEKTNA